MASKSLIASRFALLATALAVASGCSFSDRLAREWGGLKRLLGRAASSSSHPQASPSPGEENLLGPNAQRALENRELLREVFAVVLLRDPMSPDSKNRSAFASLLDTLNQGASLEGLYNGLTHSADYRRLELGGGTASPERIRAFAELLSLLGSELPAPTLFDASSAQPLQVLNADGSVQGVETMVFPGKGAKPSPIAAEKGEGLVESYVRIFANASPYTLKRVAGDEALKVIAAKKASNEKLAIWYGQWVVRMSAFGVDFGIPLRNKADGEFHRQWALQAPHDRLVWEVLTRVHRVLNHKGQ